MNIPLDLILPDPDQPRKTFPSKSLESLAQSIRENGVIQPIVVQEYEGKYIIVDGERRYRAAKLAGLTEIPADIDDMARTNGSGTRLLRALVANLQREDLTPIEEAQSYRRLQTEFGMTVAQVALKVGKHVKTIDDRLILLKLDPEIQDLVAEGSLHRDPRLAKGLLSIPDANIRKETAKGIVKRGVKLTTALKVCERVGEALANVDKDIFEHDPPSMAIAKNKVKNRGHRTEWDILKQLGKAPPWHIVTNSAIFTCDNCGLRPVASPESCGECPAVDMLRRMLEICKPC